MLSPEFEESLFLAAHQKLRLSWLRKAAKLGTQKTVTLLSLMKLGADGQPNSYTDQPLNQRKQTMNRLQKLKNDVYSFEELDTLEKNAIKLGDSQTLSLIEFSRASKKAKGEKPTVVETARARRDRKRNGQ